jgi:hypothetical protein
MLKETLSNLSGFLNQWHGRRNWGAGGAAAPVALYQEGQGGAKMPFQFKELPCWNSELSEMLVQFFYEFASENARNAVIELQE